MPFNCLKDSGFELTLGNSIPTGDWTVENSPYAQLTDDPESLDLNSEPFAGEWEACIAHTGTGFEQEAGGLSQSVSLVYNHAYWPTMKMNTVDCSNKQHKLTCGIAGSGAQWVFEDVVGQGLCNTPAWRSATVSPQTSPYIHTGGTAERPFYIGIQRVSGEDMSIVALDQVKLNYCHVNSIPK